MQACRHRTLLRVEPTKCRAGDRAAAAAVPCVLQYRNCEAGAGRVSFWACRVRAWWVCLSLCGGLPQPPLKKGSFELP